MKKKTVLSVCFIISLLPMLLNQYGGLRGVREITGLINLINPIGIASVILFFSGVWLNFEKPFVGKYVGGIGAIGIVVSEVYKYFTWYTLTIVGEVSLQNSIELAFPEFYFGLAVSVIMAILYFVLWDRAEE